MGKPARRSTPGVPVEAIVRPTLPVAYQQAMESGERLVAQAVEKGVAMDALERLLAMRKELLAEAARGAFNESMARFQAACPVIPKKKTAKVKSQRTGSEFTYKYADLGSIVKIAKPLIAAEGLSYTIKCRFEGDVVISACIVSHTLGHSETSEFRIPVDKGAVVNDAQKTAIAQTYGKRMAFTNAFGILTGDEDTDGNGAGEPREEPEHKPVAQPSVRQSGLRRESPRDKEPMSEGQLRLLRAKLGHANLSEDDLPAELKPITKLTFGQFPDVQAWISANGR